MPCNHVDLGQGVRAIVCTPTRRCACTRPAALLCDWKMPNKKSGTCDAPICQDCTTSPAEDKDLCRKHARMWKEWQRQQAAKRRRCAE